MDRVDHVDSAVHLDVRRDDLLERDRKGFRLGTVAGMSVQEPDGRQVGHVLDARFEPTDNGDLVLRSLLVGRGGPGSLLGYDRRADQGPVMVRRSCGSGTATGVSSTSPQPRSCGTTSKSAYAGRSSPSDSEPSTCKQGRTLTGEVGILREGPRHVRTEHACAFATPPLTNPAGLAGLLG
jgi:hypothetical protein